MYSARPFAGSASGNTSIDHPPRLGGWPESSLEEANGPATATRRHASREAKPPAGVCLLRLLAAAGEEPR
jgi:hypothetical protein